MNESRLKTELCRDLEAGFSALVQHYQDRLYRFGLRLSGSPRDAEEIAQDTFVRAYRAMRDFSEDRLRQMTLDPWIYTIALNVFRNRARRKQLPTVPLEEEHRSWDGDPGSAAMNGAGHDEATRIAVERMVAALPDRYRVPLVLRHIEGLPYNQIAAVVGQPVGTVKANVHRALASLRAGLAKEETR